VALAVALGVVIAVSSSGTTNVKQSADGAAASASASVSGAATTTASPAATSTAATTVPEADTYDTGPIATTQLGDVATNPVDGTGAAINMRQTAAEAASSMNCTLAVPANPLTATGLATPWQLGDGCSMANAGTEGAFVEATILSPSGQLQVYNPLVITTGTRPAAKPAAPTIASGSEVIIDIGFNGTNLALTGAGATEGKCVDASGQSVIGQVSACNAVPFYNMANKEVSAGTLTVPALGTASDGQACQTTRDFALIDQDQSDNVVTSYLINSSGQTAQNTSANASSIGGAQTLTNGSDDGLLAAFVDLANGCKPFAATDSTAAAGSSASQALNELQAKADQPASTMAVTPPNDEMTLVGGQMSLAKTNVYRSLVDQPQLASGTSLPAVAAAYCQNMVNTAPARDNTDYTADEAFATPVAATGTNLASFLANRLSMSFTNLNCSDYGLTDPVTVTLNSAGVGTGGTYALTEQKASTSTTSTGTTTTVNPRRGQGSGSQSRGSRRNRVQDPSGV
jgi:hypothetical protein